MQEGRDDREFPPWRQITFYLLTLAVLILCALILQPFFSAIVGAIVLAVVTEIPYNWLSARIPHRTTCATIALIFVILAVIVPGFFLAQELGEHALKAIVSLRNPNAQNTITDYIGNHPALANRIEAFSASIDVNNAARTTAAYVGSKAATVLGNSVHLITEMVVMLFLLFFLLRDRHLALAALRSIIPLREDETNELLERIDDTIYATFLGRLAIALVQGVLAGLAFWTLGLPGVILWSITLTAFAMIPAFGAFLIWGPIAIYLGLNDHWGKATLLAIWGGFIVSTIDNILYPILIGGHLRSHTAIILITVLGGIAVFGPLGIILGPVIFTIASTLLDIWQARARQIVTQPDSLSGIHSL
jgi:predicted PurR-regulated permease PerM